MDSYHIPVLLDEVVRVLNPSPDKTFIDATLGHGGHTLQLLDRGAIVYGIEADKNNLNLACKRISNKNFYPILGNFKDIKKIWEKHIQTPVDGILADLGLSYDQQSQPGRGFSFNDDTSIDMRLSQNQKLTAENIINTYDEEQLFSLFSKISQEPLSRPLAQKIIQARQKKAIKTGSDLAQIIRQYYESKKIRSSIDPATKIFMALRIATNHEFENLNKLLKNSQKIVKKGGVIAIISFHSGEDRIVKNFIKKNNYHESRFLPNKNEQSRNHLSRSAVLRAYTV